MRINYVFFFVSVVISSKNTQSFLNNYLSFLLIRHFSVTFSLNAACHTHQCIRKSEED